MENAGKTSDTVILSGDHILRWFNLLREGIWGGANIRDGSMRQSYVYIMTGRSDALYTGVTSALEYRTSQHKQKLLPGFTKRYNLTSLVYYEVHDDILSAIAREKQIKGWSRAKKIALIESMNPQWRDLSEDWSSE